MVKRRRLKKTPVIKAKQSKPSFEHLRLQYQTKVRKAVLNTKKDKVISHLKWHLGSKNFATFNASINANLPKLREELVKLNIAVENKRLKYLEYATNLVDSIENVNNKQVISALIDRMGKSSFHKFFETLKETETKETVTEKLEEKLIQLIAEEKRAETDDPVDINEDEFLREQGSSRHEDRFDQIFDEKNSRGLVLQKSMLIADLATPEVTQTLQEMVRANTKHEKGKMFSRRLGTKTSYSETRKQVVMVRDVGRNESLPTAQEKFTEEYEAESTNALTEDKKRLALSFVFTCLDEIKALECIKPSLPYINDKDIIISIISNFGSPELYDDRQCSHRDFTDKG